MPEIDGWQDQDPERRWRWRVALPAAWLDADPAAIVNAVATRLDGDGVTLDGGPAGVCVGTFDDERALLVNADADPEPSIDALALGAVPQPPEPPSFAAALERLDAFVADVRSGAPPDAQTQWERLADIAEIVRTTQGGTVQ